MTRCNQIRLTLVGLFCAGLLLIGIGVGISFNTASEFTYAGSCLLDSTSAKHTSFEVPLQEGFKYDVISPLYLMLSPSADAVSVEYDPAAAPGTLRLDVYYRSAVTEPYLNTCDLTENTGEIFLGGSMRKPIGLLFAYKDTLFSDLRNRRIGDYLEFSIDRVILTAHPDDAEAFALVQR